MPRYVPRIRKRLTFSYKRPRRSKPRRKEARRIEHANTEIVAFDHGPAEFPVATIRPRDGGSLAVALLGALQRWFAARWTWFQPRAAPMIVAALGMVGVIWTADYLAHHLDQPQPRPVQTDILVGFGR